MKKQQIRSQLKEIKESGIEERLQEIEINAVLDGYAHYLISIGVKPMSAIGQANDLLYSND